MVAHKSSGWATRDLYLSPEDCNCHPPAAGIPPRIPLATNQLKAVLWPAGVGVQEVRQIALWAACWAILPESAGKQNGGDDRGVIEGTLRNVSRSHSLFCLCHISSGMTAVENINSAFTPSSSLCCLPWIAGLIKWNMLPMIKLTTPYNAELRKEINLCLSLAAIPEHEQELLVEMSSCMMMCEVVGTCSLCWLLRFVYRWLNYSLMSCCTVFCITLISNMSPIMMIYFKFVPFCLRLVLAALLTVHSVYLQNCSKINDCFLLAFVPRWCMLNLHIKFLQSAYYSFKYISFSFSTSIRCWLAE